MGNAFTSYIDTAQVVLYLFWIFFFGLIWWLRKEDRREGYPLEKDNPRIVGTTADILFPTPKTFALPHGGTYTAPNFSRDTRDVGATRTSAAAGSPLEPTGAPMLAGVGPSSWAAREDAPELTRDGRDAIVPLRIATDFRFFAGSDPRGWDVRGLDEALVGICTDIWVDRSDMQVRYIEVALTGIEGDEGKRLIPYAMFACDGDKRVVRCAAITGAQFADVPVLKSVDKVTLLEEEKIGAYYAGGRMYATAKRLGPVV